MQPNHTPPPLTSQTNTLPRDISRQEALALILEHAAPPNPSAEPVPLAEALGRVLARDFASPLDLPPFDNSSVDGYAVRAADTTRATPAAPAILPCALTLAAAPSSGQETLQEGHCARIMTGAPLPQGADAVAMREDVDESRPERIVFASSTCRGENVRLRGEDIARGEVAVQAGTRLRASELALLAACGAAIAEVARRPRVAIITTGDELAEPGQALRAGQIYNSNAVSLAALCQECGAEVTLQAHCGDDAGELARLLGEAARSCDAVVTSGGVSAGDFDPVRDVLLGTREQPAVARAVFWKARIKPGRPVLFAVARDSGGREVPVFALPGNPVSVAVTFELFARPALLAMQGAGSERRRVRARPEEHGASPVGKTEFVRAYVAPEPGSSSWSARVTGAQGSGRLTTMSRANALLVVPEGASGYGPGDELEAILLD